MNEICHTLLEAVVTLYPADDDGVPMTDFPIWTGVAAESLVITERWIKIQNRPVGARQPRNHPLLAQFEIAIGRVWAMQPSDANGFLSDNGRYVLDIVWTDEDEGRWHRKTFYGVTISERSQNGQAADREFTDNQSFDAESFVPANGSGTVTDISNDLPYLVRYVTAQGSCFVYSYDPDLHVFTELLSGLAAQTVEFEYLSSVAVPLYNSSLTYRNSTVYRNVAAFVVRFHGQSDDALRMGGDGVMEVADAVVGAPMRDSLPRVDFCYGGKRMASVSQSGVLFAWGLEKSTPEEVSPGYEFFSGDTLLATITQKAVRATDFV